MKVHHVGEGAPKELKLDVTLDAPRAAVWRCWTEPALLKEWHCPKPWRVAEADLDVRPGGRFNAVFAGPNGERHDHKGAYLEVVPMRRLMFTDGHSEGFMPAEKHFMTGYVELSDAPEGKTRMVWGARHACEADLKTHLEMGFVEGWRSAARQLEELAKAADPIAPAGAQAEVRALVARWSRAVEAKDAAAIVADYAPDAVLSTRSRPRARSARAPFARRGKTAFPFSPRRSVPNIGISK